MVEGDVMICYALKSLSSEVHLEKADLRWQLLRRPVDAPDFCFASEAGMQEQKVELKWMKNASFMMYGEKNHN